ncbi:MAG TPA: hypothetical protein VI006_13255 [Solirubrobacteraceae bacterium]
MEQLGCGGGRVPAHRVRRRAGADAFEIHRATGLRYERPDPIVLD